MCFCDVFIIVIICYYCFEEIYLFLCTVFKKSGYGTIPDKPRSMLNITQIFNNTKFSQDCLFVAFNIQMLILVHYVLT